MSTCTNMDVFVLLCVCLFVCVCILCSVVYQDGFYGADIYVSIIYWYEIACYIAISFVSALMLHTCKTSNFHTHTCLHIQPGEQLAGHVTVCSSEKEPSKETIGYKHQQAIRQGTGCTLAKRQQNYVVKYIKPTSTTMTVVQINET